VARPASPRRRRVRVDIGYFVICHEVRAGVAALAQRDLQRFAIHDVARTDVVDHRAAEDVFVGTLGGYPIGGLADDDAQLGFVLRLFGQHAVHSRPAYTKRRGAIVLAGSPHELICSGATG
jgi:hypothetical protein